MLAVSLALVSLLALAPEPGRTPRQAGPRAPIPLEPTHFGTSVAGLGDCDLDGSSDVALGAWWDEAKGGHGAVHVFSGKTGEALHVLRGRERDALFGLCVAGVGDVDSDSTADFAVSAPLETRRGKAVGVVRVYSGRDGKLLHELEGTVDGERFGWSIAGAGDVDQDGFADFVVGAPFARVKDSVPGAARVYSGKSGKQLFEWLGERDGERFGWSVDGAGDCDADGKADLVVASLGGERVRIFQGRRGRLLFDLRAPRAGERFGFQVRGVRDTDQDGADDIVVGLPFGEREGAIVYSGKKGEPLFTLERPLEAGKEGWSFGVAVGGAGDVDADGFDDVIVGDPGFPVLIADLLGGPAPAHFARVRQPVLRPGRAYVYGGQRGKLLMSFEGTAPDDLFGVSVDSAGDVNQDGFADLIVGAGPTAPFQARVIDGKTGKPIRDHALR